EEIGSVGATGMDSLFLENAASELLARMGRESCLAIRRTLRNSMMLSSDVNSAYDPLNASLFDKKNSSYLAKGVVFNKYTGSRGKSGASDANAEFIAKLRAVMDSNSVNYQMAEMAKVDVGGGGTIAKFAAYYGMQVIDCGVAVLSMHAPWEITAVEDVLSAKACYKAFLTLR
ncbi:MAG: aminopeptidase, partial [Candidatus Ornithospirochaeta sp.]|nr:aminopeptidase [Candidatus Ornithospirochaeta sp.]